MYRYILEFFKNVGTGTFFQWAQVVQKLVFVFVINQIKKII